ncbi:MAG: hypothetical protein HYS77_16510, partial [Candidatus Rokubacteria bacterium]|nr:hypothetical protein [Candidatus Rokubacteria bacterium]
QITYDLRLTYGLGENLSMNWGASYIVFDDNRVIDTGITGGDKYTWQTQAGLTVKPLKSLTITPSYNYTLIDEKKKQVVRADGLQVLDRVVGQTHTGTLTLAQEIIPKLLNLDIQASAASTTTSDDATNNQTYGGTGRITWNLGKLFWDYGKQALSLRTNFNRTRDMVTHTDTNEIGVFLILDLLSPYNL